MLFDCWLGSLDCRLGTYYDYDMAIADSLSLCVLLLSLGSYLYYPDNHNIDNIKEKKYRIIAFFWLFFPSLSFFLSTTYSPKISIVLSCIYIIILFFYASYLLITSRVNISDTFLAVVATLVIVLQYNVFSLIGFFIVAILGFDPIRCLNICKFFVLFLPFMVFEEDEEIKKQQEDAHSTTKCDSDENCLTKSDDTQDLGQNARDLSFHDKGQPENQQTDKQDTQDTANQNKPQNEQEKPAKPHQATRQAENQSQENYHKNYGVHEKPQQTKQKSDIIDGVSGSLNALPIDHLPKGVNRVSVKEIYSTKLCNNPKIELEKMSKVAAQSVPCGANNPYEYDSPPYWIWEWSAHSNNLTEAFGKAQNEKMCQWSDAKTAAEHYLFARLLATDPELSKLRRMVNRKLLPSATLVYSGIKFMDHSFADGFNKVNRLLGSHLPDYKAKTSRPTKLQMLYEFKGTNDGDPDNFNKDMELQFGVCIPIKKGKK